MSEKLIFTNVFEVCQQDLAGTVTPELIAVVGILITTKNLTNALAHHSKYQRHSVEKERDKTFLIF